MSDLELLRSEKCKKALEIAGPMEFTDRGDRWRCEPNINGTGLLTGIYSLGRWHGTKRTWDWVSDFSDHEALCFLERHFRVWLRQKGYFVNAHYCGREGTQWEWEWTLNSFNDSRVKNVHLDVGIDGYLAGLIEAVLAVKAEG